MPWLPLSQCSGSLAASLAAHPSSGGASLRPSPALPGLAAAAAQRRVPRRRLPPCPCHPLSLSLPAAFAPLRAACPVFVHSPPSFLRTSWGPSKPDGRGTAERCQPCEPRNELPCPDCRQLVWSFFSPAPQLHTFACLFRSPRLLPAATCSLQINPCSTQRVPAGCC